MAARPTDSPAPLLEGGAPRDSNHAVLLSLGLQGIGALFAWNAIITPISYYQLRFAGSPFRDSFESLLSVTFTSIALGSLLSLQLVQHRLSLRAVIILSLTTQLGVFSVMTLYTLWPVLQSVEGLRSEIARNATASFVVTLVCTAVMAATQAVLTSSVISYSAAFPPAYTKAVSSGMAVAGLAVSVAGLATAGDEHAASSDAELRATILSAVIYFGVAVAIFATCLGSFLAAERTAFVRMTRLEQTAVCETLRSDEAATTHEVAECNELATHVNTGGGCPQTAGCSMSKVAQNVFPYALAMVLNYTVTIGLFPAITGMISSVSDSAAWQRIFPASLFLLYNIGDLVGRTFPPPWLAGKRRLLLFSLCRAIHVPLFMTCHMPLGKSTVPTLLGVDAAPMLLVLILGVTNGMLTSSLLMRAPHAVPPAQASRAASLMVLSLNSGLLFGSLTSFLLHSLLCDCNPFLA
mmetsp:Transcript_7461/g.23086  ORF Transcript_7461/g.23086 Transcript_7461/m.23086 type:complete len:465 (-) Transcript_7461:832-2226(-)